MGGYASRETKAIKHSLYYAGRKRRAAQLTHVAGNGYITSDHGIVVDNHIFILILYAFLNCIGRLSENGFPDVGMYRHEDWEKPDLAFGCLRR